MDRIAVNVFLLIIIHVSALGQQDIRLEALKRGQPGKTSCYDSSTNANGLNKIFIRYLGSKKSDNGNEFKVLTWSRVWGPDKHTTGVIYVYNKKNIYVGRYILGDAWDLPNKVEKNSLIFNKKKKGCDPGAVTRIDFSEGHPKEIFLKCKGEYGDIYSFSTEE